MRTVLWDEKYAIGEAEIDSQHKELFMALRELQLELYGVARQDVVMDKISILQQYCLHHFKAEMALMAPYAEQLPMYKEHMAEHAKFAQVTVDFTKRVDAEGVGIIKELCEFIIDWLLNHIMHMDKKTFDAIRELSAKA